MARHLMVDLETLSTKLNCVILTLGAVIFDPFSDQIYKSLYLKIDTESQDVIGSIIDESVLEWWTKQDSEIVNEAFDPSDRLDISDAIDLFHKFAWNCEKFWSNGSIYDIMVLESTYNRLNKPLPWNYYQIRDTRTIYDLSYPDMPQSSKHNALEDAKRQAIGVQNVYRNLGIKQST